MLLTLMLVPQNVWAWGGSGTSSSPYTISSAADLLKFANIVNGANGETKNISACANLTADITLSGTWKPIGNSSGHYKGTFDGQGHKISGLSITGYTAVNSGFFGYVEGATIKNFTLSGTMSSATQITGGENDCSGAVVARAIGASTIQDIVSSVNWTLTKAQKHLGGVVGQIDGSTTVARCTYSGTLDAGPTTDCVGGIVGFAAASCSGSITNCCFSGTLKSSSSAPTLGGILGYTNDESSNFGGVQLCFSHGTFSFGTSDYKYVNAIVGRIRNRATTTINNFYLSTTASRACNTDGPSIPASNKAATLDECKSGDITWKLNGEAAGSGTTKPWRQNLNAKNYPQSNPDDYPTLNTGHAPVYMTRDRDCMGNYNGASYYSNSSTYRVIHDMVYHDPKEPTCTHDGHKEYYLCNWCSIPYLDSEGNIRGTRDIDKLGHNYTTAAKDYCDRCKHYMIHYICPSGQVTPLSGANFSSTGSSMYESQLSEYDESTGKGIIAIGNKITLIPNTAFRNRALTSITIPTTVTSIGNQAFYNCPNLTSIEIPNSVTSIGNSAFVLSGLTGSLIIPNSVTSIGEKAFAGCAFDGALTLGNSLKTISAEAFQGCGFKGDLIIPNSVTHIFRSAFENCGFDGKLVLGNSLSEIYPYAFKNCAFTGDLVIPNSLSTIYYEAFCDCKFNGNLTLGNSVYTIESNAFYNCKFNGNLTIGNSVYRIGTDAFYNCSFNGKLTAGTNLGRLSPSAFIGSSFSEVELHSLPRVVDEDNNYANPFPNVDNINLIIEDNSRINTHEEFPNLRSVCYVRNISADSQWGSLVLPFNTVSNDDVQLYMLKDVRNQQMILTPVESVERSTPCIFKKKKESATSVTFTGDGFDNAFNNSVEVIGPNGRWVLYGWYDDVTQRNCYFIAQNKFWYADDPVTIKRFRVEYFIHNIGTAAAKSLGIVVDDDATGVKDINAAKGMQSGKFLEGGQIVIVKNGKKYNANGQEVK